MGTEADSSNCAANARAAMKAPGRCWAWPTAYSTGPPSGARAGS